MTPDAKPVPVDARILFAAERTLFAYVRTGLALMGFGFVVARFGIFLRQLSVVAGAGTPKQSPASASGPTGILLVLCGVILCVYAPVWYRKTVLRLERGEGYAAPSFGVASAVAVLVAVLGLVMAFYLFFLR